MKSKPCKYLFSALCYAAAVAASNLHKRLTKPTINSEPQVLSLNFQKHSVSSEHPNLKRHRWSINEESLQSPSSLIERATYVQQAVDNDQLCTLKRPVALLEKRDRLCLSRVYTNVRASELWPFVSRECHNRETASASSPSIRNGQ